MSKRTILTVKKDLASVFPDVVFTYPKVFNGRYRVEWSGGPSEADVRYAGQLNDCTSVMGCHRTMTDAELATASAQWDIEEAEREAAEPALRAARKASGLAQASATREAKKQAARVLAAAYPDVEFTVTAAGDGNLRVTWTNGPDERAVQVSLPSFPRVFCNRHESDDVRDARYAAQSEERAWNRMSARARQGVTLAATLREAGTTHATRLARRLAQSMVRARRVAGIIRRATAQLCFDFLPYCA